MLKALPVEMPLPQIRINSTSNEWEVSIDGGNTWTNTGVMATGDKGDTGATGATGDSWISDINYSADGKNWSDTSSSESKYVKFILAKGGELVFPTQAWAKEVEAQLKTLTEQIQAFSSLISGKSFIKSITPATGTDGRNGQLITYVVAKADGTTNREQTFTIYDGAKGADGTTSAAPAIGVEYEENTGNYYWTVGGKKLTDGSGKPIRANG
ncbi:MAG: PL29 family lyase N-terminal domain-containing protein [Bacteroides sp.]|nr:PL29 family lyase N-terminal domain-containing protein [Bacteroides sp.]